MTCDIENEPNFLGGRGRETISLDLVQSTLRRVIARLRLNSKLCEISPHEHATPRRERACE